MASVMGIDMGGSGVKGAPVETDSGDLLGERTRFETPQPSTPEAVLAVIQNLVEVFDWNGQVGLTVPGVVREGIVESAVNIDPEWMNLDAEGIFSEGLGREVTVLNDADAAGIAEITLGAGRGRPGLVFLATFGTGIGSALFFNGELLPNTELGHIEIDGQSAEPYAAGKVRKEQALEWADYADRVDTYLARIQRYLNPDLMIIGGGVSKKHEDWLHYLKRGCEVVPAHFGNNAGIIGAAISANSSKG